MRSLRAIHTLDCATLIVLSRASARHLDGQSQQVAHALTTGPGTALIWVRELLGQAGEFQSVEPRSAQLAQDP
eukprot:scaffold20564_cov28-Tisochrysis_lutea.AAC.2